MIGSEHDAQQQDEPNDDAATPSGSDGVRSAQDSNERDVTSRDTTERWRALPPRVEQSDMVESQPESPQPSVPAPAGDPADAWMMRW